MAPKARCSCGCAKIVSSETERRHRRQKAPPTAQATAAARGKGPLAPLLSRDLRSESRLSSRLRINFLPVETPAAGPVPHSPMDVDDASRPVDEDEELRSVDDDGEQEGGPDAEDGLDLAMDVGNTTVATTSQTADEDADDATLANARAALQARVWAGRTRRTAYVEDVEDVEEERHDDNGDNGDESSSSDDSDEDSDEDVTYPPYTTREVLSEQFMQRLRQEERKLSEEDLAYLRLFALKTETHLKGSIYEKLKFAFPTSPVPSWKQCQSRASRLSGYEPQQLDCCVKSCCCFTGPHADLNACPYCTSSRYDAHGRPRQVFLYFPIIPRLKAFLANVELATRMRYRAHEHVHDPTKVQGDRRLRLQSVS
ncbi:hypothetical protein BC629DRAFT_1444119 [Irpex lacteus]|nr:hypothetical protein BC629DRAFT_1444119 [Irpex lacteus]